MERKRVKESECEGDQPGPEVTGDFVCLFGARAR